MNTASNIFHLPLGTGLAACSADVLDGAAPKKRVRLVPMGKIEGRDGRGPYVLADKAHAASVVAASLATAGSTDIPVDYDHQLVFAAKDGVGGTAPASGWITSLSAEDDGIYANIEWTDPAAAKIAAREYRYISPYFGFDKASGRITRIWNAGLTAFPNFTELAAVASSQIDESQMDKKALAKALGLSETATDAEIEAAVTANRTGLAAANAQLAAIGKNLGLADSAKPEEIAAAASAKIAGAGAEPDPKLFVPMSSFKELQASVKSLQDSGTEGRATAAVDAAITAGKITPAGRDHALKLFKADEAAFNDFVGAAPAIVKKEDSAAAAARTGEVALTEDERKVGRMMGRTDDQLLAAKKALV